MFATTLLACDMGGYPLAMELAGDNVAIGKFAGLILGTIDGTDHRIYHSGSTVRNHLQGQTVHIWAQVFWPV